MPISDSLAPRRHDVLIVGGGLVGASLAIALEGLGLDIGMVEASMEGQLSALRRAFEKVLGSRV